MAYDFNKRVANLQQRVEDDATGRIGLRGASVIAITSLFIAVSALSILFPPLHSEDWASSTLQNVNRRIEWLDKFPVGGPGSAERYKYLAQVIVDSFLYHRSDEAKVDADPQKKKPFFDAEGVIEWVTQSACNFLLRLSFVVLSFWPFWVIGGVVGWFVLGARSRAIAPTKDLLGICSRGTGPFYSGIFGPLRPNNGIAGTDMSVPSLACPPMVAAQSALNHPMQRLLKQFGADNETNLNLLRIILAHADFPATVEDESPVEDEEQDSDSPEQPRSSLANSAFTTNKDGTLERSTAEGLQAILEAHSAIFEVLVLAQDKAGKKLSNGAIPAAAYFETVQHVAAKLSPLGRMLLVCLTQNRAAAIKAFDSKKVATAYLATEAGKSLVYRREEGGFVRISRFPQLQARAIVQSIVNYHEDYNGDDRLIIRQAILSARRHGDFGRAFLPVSMQIESRALRDWLEILYAQAKHRTESAQLVELDGYIEEIGATWNREFYARMRKSASGASVGDRWWKGMTWRSIVLMPLKNVIEIALSETEPARLRRIGELLSATRNIQASITIAARLPGFKRQAIEAQKSGLEADSIVQGLLQAEGGKQLLERWIVVRRMLNRNNWLSTRIGDDAVSVDGLVQAVVLDRAENPDQPEVLGFEALVPLRQRRFKEIFGARWDSLYYADSPHPNDIEPFNIREKFQTTIEQRRREAERGQLGLISRRRTESPASAAQS